MKVVIAPNCFKECLSSPDVASAMARGVRNVRSNIEILEVPVADGGDGTLDAMVCATGGEIRVAEVEDPLGRLIRARYGMLGDGQTAVIEMAESSGLRLLTPNERNPLITSTYGLGQLIRAAINGGAKCIIAGIGGSATNDGGAGMAQALGCHLLDSDGKDIGRGGQALLDLHTVNASEVIAEFEHLRVRVACDVNNPLCGPNGAASVFGPQKGATPDMVETLDMGLANMARVLEQSLRINIRDIPGSGAAGGLGGGLVGFLGGVLLNGIDLILDHTGLQKALRGADLVLTGEGAIDVQTAYGKAPVGVAKMAKKTGIPVIALAGILREGFEEIHKHGIDAAFAISQGPADLSFHMENAALLIEKKTEQVMRLFLASGQMKQDAL
jgi:glycerate 2-kinase